ncbi:MAG TPA: sulfatase, partial [Nitrospiria bacterium]
RSLMLFPRRTAVILAAGFFGLAAINFLPSHSVLRGSSGAAQSDRLNVLLLAVDSLRYDHLSCHGYGREAAPSIDALCRNAVDFEQAYVSLPRTFPSLVTILTGLYPDRHGIRHMFPTAKDRNHPLPGLPRALSDAGYRTAAISDFSGDVLTRVDLGFNRVQAPHFNFPALLRMRGLEMHAPLLPYLDNPFGRAFFPDLREFVQASEPALLGREALRAIEKMKDGPFFLTVFFSTPHFPYAAPYPDYRRFTDPDYRGPYKYHKPNLINQDETVGPGDIEQIRGLYDGAVRSVDREIGRILDGLRRTGLSDRTIVIVTADHGEQLYELDRGMGHGEHLRGDTVLRVPLIWSDPQKGRKPGKIKAPVRSVDLVPTLLDRLGLEDPVVRDGVSLMPLLRGEREDLGLPVFAETGIWFVESGSQFFQDQRMGYPNVVALMEVDTHRDDEIVLKEEYRNIIETAKHRMIQKGRYKLISIPTRNGVRYELYDYAGDPENRRPLDPSAHRAVFESLRTELWAWMERDRSIAVKNGYRLPRPD